MARSKRLKIKETIKTHIINNGKEYIIVSLIFVIGIFLGVLFVNNIKDVPKEEVISYFNEFVDKLKNTESIDNLGLLKTSMSQNIILAVTIWFFGTTVIRTSSSVWNGFVPRLLLRLYNSNRNTGYGLFKRLNVYFN